MPPIQPDHTDTYLVLAGTLGGVALTGLFAYFQSRGQRGHERALSDRADLRSALAATLEAHESLHRSSTAALRAALQEEPQARAAAVHGMWEAVERYNASDASLRIRLGDEHPIALVRAKLDKVNDALVISGETGDKAAHEKAMGDREAVLKEFVAAAVREVGTKTP